MSDTDWYKDAIIYEITVKGFFDSNADGVGDFQGLTQKLDYLQYLGVDCIWLTPFFQSPLRDDGYDIADYFNILPEYGTVADFEKFVEEAHIRGIRVLADLVMNHTSDQNAWFQQARQSRDSPYRDYYVWSDTDDKYLGARIIFIDTERSNWTYDSTAGQFYWHRFFSHQPDLNFDNPVVHQEMFKVLDFWMSRGLDGFRCDAVPYLYEREGTNCENLPETHAFCKKLRAYLDEHYPGKVLLAEANQWPADLRPYFGDGDEFQMCFNFPLMPRLFMALRREVSTPIVDIIAQLPDIPPNCQWGIFLRNHDELTLEMVTDEERDYMWAEYAKDRRMRLNLGIRRRLAPLVDNSREQYQLLKNLLFSLPGTPCMYYGDELGMGDNIYLGDRNGVRTPMQWSGDRNGGFSRADSMRLYAPVIDDPVYGYQGVNVEAQQRDPDSPLQWIRRRIALRKKYPVFGRGDTRFLQPENQKVLTFLRCDPTTTILVVANLSRHAQPVQVDLSEYKGYTPVEMVGETAFPPIGDLPYFLTLGPYGFYSFRLDPPPAG